jgi:hypothetical protein
MRLVLVATIGMLLPLVPMVTKAQDSRECDCSALPQEIQTQIHKRFKSWRIQQPEDLSYPARETWNGEKPTTCPGIAVGKFKSPDSSYAILLVRMDHPDSAYRFLVFSRTTGQPFQLTTVEEWNGGGARNYFLVAEPISKWFDRAWMRRLHVQAPQGILFVDSAKKEFEADLYFWADGRFRHEWVDY